MKMRNRTLYTAVGHFKKVVTKDGAYPVVLVNQEEYRMDPQEMTVWTILNWRILDAQGVEEQYEPLFRTLVLEERRTLEHCLGRLVTRGLVAAGHAFAPRPGSEGDGRIVRIHCFAVLCLFNTCLSSVGIYWPDAGLLPACRATAPSASPCCRANPTSAAATLQTRLRAPSDAASRSVMPIPLLPLPARSAIRLWPADRRSRAGRSASVRPCA